VVGLTGGIVQGRCDVLRLKGGIVSSWISDGDAPAASIPRISDTRIRMPLIQGRPPQTFGAIVAFGSSVIDSSRMYKIGATSCRRMQQTEVEHYERQRQS
jgi:hypothetical protein